MTIEQQEDSKKTSPVILSVRQMQIRSIRRHGMNPCSTSMTLKLSASERICSHQNSTKILHRQIKAQGDVGGIFWDLVKSRIHSTRTNCHVQDILGRLDDAVRRKFSSLWREFCITIVFLSMDSCYCPCHNTISLFCHNFISCSNLLLPFPTHGKINWRAGFPPMKKSLRLIRQRVRWSQKLVWESASNNDTIVGSSV